MTNYDYIRSLSLEDMSKAFMEIDWYDSSCELRKGYECETCLTNWLKSERKESGGEINDL